MKDLIFIGILFLSSLIMDSAKDNPTRFDRWTTLFMFAAFVLQFIFTK